GSRRGLPGCRGCLVRGRKLLRIPYSRVHLLVATAGATALSARASPRRRSAGGAAAAGLQVCEFLQHGGGGAQFRPLVLVESLHQRGQERVPPAAALRKHGLRL